MPRSELNQEMEAGSEPGEHDLSANFHKVKHVFDLLIAEASYLIDEKAFKLCAEGNKTKKEQFLIMVDSIRTSLSIDNMEDI
jgi:hypothetical protein